MGRTLQNGVANICGRYAPHVNDSRPYIVISLCGLHLDIELYV